MARPEPTRRLRRSSTETALVRQLVETRYPAEYLAFKANHVSTRLLKEYIGVRLWAVVHNVHSRGQALGKILAAS